MGASGASATSLSKAIREEAEAMLSDKRVVSTDVAIQENKEKMKVAPCLKSKPTTFMAILMELGC